MQGIILVAGLGSRLKEITKITPKSLLKVDGQPILERNIGYMMEAGFERVVLVVGYQKERFEYLRDKYQGFELVLVENREFRTSNTVSSLFLAKDYFNQETYITTADIYLKTNPFLKYREDYSFYLLRPAARYAKPDWIARLDENLRFISVNQRAYEGYSYTGISHWIPGDLAFIHDRLCEINWENPSERLQYWDELILPYLPQFALYAKILEDDSEVYEFDDYSDVEKLQKEQNVSVTYQ